MTILKVEIDLDWIDEDENISDIVKRELVGSVESKVVHSLKEKVEKKVLELVDEQVTQKINEMVSTSVVERVKEIMEKPRNITDRWGEVVTKGATIDSMIKDMVDKGMAEKCLNEDGKYSTNSYDKKYSLFDLCLKKKTGAYLESQGSLIVSKVQTAIDESKENIEKMVAEKIRVHVADNLTNMIMENSSTLGLKGNSKSEQ
jgi:hypothetical protein